MFSITSSEHLIRFASIESPFGFICPQIIKKHLTPSLRGNSETKVYTYDIAKWTLELSIQNDNFVSSKRVIDRTSKKVDRFNSCIAQCITPSSVQAFQSNSFKLPSYLKPYKISYKQGQKILFFKSPDSNQLFPEEIRIDMKNSQISYISFSKNNKTITNTTAISQQFPTLSQLFKITVYEAEHFYIDEIFKGKLTRLSSFFS